MKTYNFPYLASGIGLFFLAVVMVGSVKNSDGATSLPLFTLLAICEFSFFVSAFATYTGVKHILSIGPKPVYTTLVGLCGVLVFVFLVLGVDLWPLK